MTTSKETHKRAFRLEALRLLETSAHDPSAPMPSDAADPTTPPTRIGPLSDPAQFDLSPSCR